MDILLQDFRYALRSLRRSPGFTAVVVTVMSLAISINIMIFSMVYGLLLRPWPLPHPESIVIVGETDAKNQDDHLDVSWQDFFTIRERARSFSSIGGWWNVNGQVTIGGEPERMPGATMTSGVLSAIGVQPQIGRDFRRDEEVWGSNWTQVLISDHLWRERFHADPHVLGTVIKVNGRSRAIVGVMPPGIHFPETAEFWIPAGFNVAEDKPADHLLRVVARLKSGVSAKQAQAEIQTFVAGFAKDRPETMAGLGAHVDEISGWWERHSWPLMTIMFLAAVFVLVIACANVANLLLARAATRRREISLRLALGAPRRRVVRQLLTESLLIAAVAAALGSLLAHWGNRLWLSSIPLQLPFYLRIVIDGPVLFYAAGITVASSLLFGMAPALFASDTSLATALREGSLQAGTSRAAVHLRQGLVVAEIVLSLVLLIGSGLLLRSFQKIVEAGDRVQTHGTTSAGVLLPIATYPNDDSRRHFLEALTPRVLALPGVDAFAASSNLPLDRDSDESRVLRQGHPDPHQAPHVETATITPGFFRVLGIPLHRGRDLRAEDGAHAPLVAIVNESAARHLWPGRDALGQQFKFAGDPDSVGYRSVVGVVEDVPQNIEGDNIMDEVYTAQAQTPVQDLWLLVHSSADPGVVATALRRTVRGLDPDLPLQRLETLKERFHFSLWLRRLFVRLLGTCAAMALVIAAVGLYGVMAYSVAQRTQEIGVRMALGAAREDVVRMIVGHAMQLTLLGCGIGLVVSFMVTRFMAQQLFGISATDPPTFIVVALILAASGLFAAWVPAMRATRVDPMVALRCD